MNRRGVADYSEHFDELNRRPTNFEHGPLS